MTIQERAQEAVERAIESADGPWASVELEGHWTAADARGVANAFERRGYRIDQVKMWEERFVVLARKREEVTVEVHQGDDPAEVARKIQGNYNKGGAR